jgi:hypothetical protein
MDEATTQSHQWSATIFDAHDLKHSLADFHVIKEKFSNKARALRRGQER